MAKISLCVCVWSLLDSACVLDPVPVHAGLVLVAEDGPRSAAEVPVSVSAGAMREADVVPLAVRGVGKVPERTTLAAKREMEGGRKDRVIRRKRKFSCWHVSSSSHLNFPDTTTPPPLSSSSAASRMLGWKTAPLSSDASTGVIDIAVAASAITLGLRPRFLCPR